MAIFTASIDCLAWEFSLCRSGLASNKMAREPVTHAVAADVPLDQPHQSLLPVPPANMTGTSCPGATISGFLCSFHNNNFRWSEHHCVDFFALRAPNEDVLPTTLFTPLDNLVQGIFPAFRTFRGHFVHVIRFAVSFSTHPVVWLKCKP